MIAGMRAPRRAIVAAAFVLLSGIAACVSLWPGSDTTPVNLSDARSAATASNRFGFDLYARIGGDGNRVVSPFSAAAALSMAAAGARGETLTQMASVLRIQTVASAHPAFHELLEALSTDDDDDDAGASEAGAEEPDGDDDMLHPRFGQGGSVEWVPDPGPGAAVRRPLFLIADRLWAQQGFHYRTEYLGLVQDNYRASLGLVDFEHHAGDAVRAIDEWVSARTRGRIPQLLGPGDLDDSARLVLTNAVYFRASWLSPFMKFATHAEDFETPDGTNRVAMMKQKMFFRYASLDGVSLVELPYEDRRVSMIVVLPDARHGLEDVEERIGRDYDRWVHTMTVVLVDLWLPRWRTESTFGLSAALRSMGMTLPFDPNRADFSGIAEAPLYISNVIQKAFIAADENGTEAAAATALVIFTPTRMQEHMEPPKEVVFHADHPFLYILRSVETGAVLFIGRVTQPSSSVPGAQATP